MWATVLAQAAVLLMGTAIVTLPAWGLWSLLESALVVNDD